MEVLIRLAHVPGSYAKEWVHGIPQNERPCEYFNPSCYSSGFCCWPGVFVMDCLGPPGTCPGCRYLRLQFARSVYGQHTLSLDKDNCQEEALLRKFDHLAINILIAGSATPVLYHGLRGCGSSMLAAMWILTVAACCVQVFLIKGPRWLYTMLYVLLGCLVLIPVAQLARNLPWQAMVLIAVGGAVYIAEQ